MSSLFRELIQQGLDAGAGDLGVLFAGAAADADAADHLVIDDDRHAAV